jgi:hypothetical protein
VGWAIDVLHPRANPSQVGRGSGWTYVGNDGTPTSRTNLLLRCAVRSTASAV